MLEDQKREKERSEKWKKSISVTRLLGTRDRAQKMDTQTTEVSSRSREKEK